MSSIGTGYHSQCKFCKKSIKGVRYDVCKTCRTAQAAQQVNTNSNSNATTNEIKVISQAEAKSLQLTNDIGTYGWQRCGSGTWVKTQKQAEAWLRQVMKGDAYRPNNIAYVWQNVYDNQDGNSIMAQKSWGANYYSI